MQTGAAAANTAGALAGGLNHGGDEGVIVLTLGRIGHDDVERHQRIARTLNRSNARRSPARRILASAHFLFPAHFCRDDPALPCFVASMSGLPPPPSQLRIDLAGWLNEFAMPDRTKGRDYYSRGKVVSLEQAVDSPFTTVFAAVRGSETYECSLTYTTREGWDGDCSCPVGYECKHLYAAGTAFLNQLAAQTIQPFEQPLPLAPSPPPKSTTPTDESSLVATFTTATGADPNRKQIPFIRSLLALHRNLSDARYFDFRALQNLLPSSHRHLFFNYYQNPFDNRWARPPATPLELWSHLALVFTEKNIPLPAFMAKLTDLAWARNAVAAYLRERELAEWRARFASLENTFVAHPATDSPPPLLRFLRLRLGRKKNLWEISAIAPVFPPPPAPPASFPLSLSPSSAPLPPRFETLSATELRELLGAGEHFALTLEPASASFAAILRAHQATSGRTTLKLTDAYDLTFLARLFNHPLTRTCIVDEAGRPITRDPRRLVWQFHDHPTDPTLTYAQLGFADGTPAPAPLLHLPAQPDLYLHDATLFTGLPPPSAHASPADVAAPVPVPRAALALPEAGRFASRAGVILPNDTTGRFRHETLRPRLRARLDPRRPAGTDTHSASDEVVLVELAALAPDSTPRALLDGDTWRRTGPGLPPPPPDATFLILDFEPTRTATQQFHQLVQTADAWHPAGPRSHVEVTGIHFPETFSTWLAGFPPNTLIELAPELAAFASAPTRAHFAIDLKPGDETGIDWFDVRVTLRAEDTTLTPADLAILHGARGRFVRLAGHGWRRLILDDSTATQEKLARLGLDPATATSETAREPLRFHALQLADESLRDALPEKLWAQVRERSAALRASPAPALPPGLVADLRPYQREGFHFLAFLSENNFGGVLADDMGLGKTLQTLTWLLHLSALKRKLPTSSRGSAAKSFRVLVVCPKSVMVNWQLETARFAPSLTTTAFTSALLTPEPETPDPKPSAASSDSQLSALGTHLLIANYTQLRLYADAFAAETWDAVILDEGQNIKNPASATAAAARALRTAHRLVLTGTPVENRLLDLWSLFSFAQPGLLGGQTAFKRLYNDKLDPAARTRLAQRVKHFLLRRTKSQVARDLPARIEEEIIVDLEGSQRALYDAELKRTRALLLGVKNNREFDSQRFNILQSLLRLRQICCDPRLVGAGELPKSPPKKSAAKSVPADSVISHSKSKRASASSKSAAASDAQLSAPDSQLASASPNSLPLPSAKLEALLDTLEPLMAEGHKVLVFSQFVTMLELIRVELTARGIAHLLLTGQTENRQALVDKFQTDPAIPVFLLSLKAAGSGLNLTAASYVVLFDPWWNPAVEAQAIDRTHRIGQKNQVMAYRLIARNTVEEKIRALQKEKAALAAAVVQEESLATVLDLASLRAILA